MSEIEFNAPKASEVVAAIQSFIDESGDLQILLKDPDTGWFLPVGIVVDDGFIQITSSYHESPDGVVGTIDK